MSDWLQPTAAGIGTAGWDWIVLDIEGTTCPVSFVAETLFPYASEHLPALLRDGSDDPAIQALLSEVERAWEGDGDPAAQALLQRRDIAQEHPPSLAYLRWLIAHDRKLPALKELQGMVWRRGYDRGELQAPLYVDVPAALQHWHGHGLGLAVYSSGSVAAQQLLYGHTQAGDLRPLFQHWFDTRTGPKKEPESYRRIAQVLGTQPAQILFISDSLAELQAADAAGFSVAFSLREHNPEQDPGPFPVIRSFTQLSPEP